MEMILHWMESTVIAKFIVQNAWAFPTLEIFHFIGLILLFGSMFVVDMRLLGVSPGIPLDAVLALLPLSLIGFAINFMTGVMFLFADPFRYYPNIAFRLKMLAVILSGLNAIWFALVLHPQITSGANGDNRQASYKTVAALSLLLWTSVIVLGRLIPYVEY